MENEMKINQEILGYFKEESAQVLKELNEIVNSLDAPHKEFPSRLLEDFSQKIDRIMGASKTIGLEIPDHLGLQRIGKLAELCKLLGYKAAEKKVSQFVPIYAAFWGDTLEVIENLLSSVEDLEKTEKIVKSFSAVLQKRLEWLLTRVEPKKAAATVTEHVNQVQDLLKSLGLE
ncbi:MAG TPA: hypothetical protein DCS07_02845 [Bdellovibrionales bacterium]|nr:MAG: hypothetical protein A2Z97_10960 [Bdellovibrionales bacterium GWB1_52_6]OFZ03521.1 MAG: hypothetical protein A2X97_06130 [Bdellovibrionales bacterium GWA1_52_35]HAR41560.1 hypothetical protein [Bdellovibrionales bacterium]HCM41108.1 hypothetical protein [Bdellovibrionales bacterium]